MKHKGEEIFIEMPEGICRNGLIADPIYTIVAGDRHKAGVSMQLDTTNLATVASACYYLRRVYKWMRTAKMIAAEEHDQHGGHIAREHRIQELNTCTWEFVDEQKRLENNRWVEGGEAKTRKIDGGE